MRRGAPAYRASELFAASPRRACWLPADNCVLVYQKAADTASAWPKRGSFVREPPGGSSGDAPAFETVARLRGRLGRISQRGRRPTVSVERVTKFPAGFSWITYGVRSPAFPARTKRSFASGRLTGCSRPIARCRNSNRSARSRPAQCLRRASISRATIRRSSARRSSCQREGRGRHPAAVGLAGPDARGRAAGMRSRPTSSARWRRCIVSTGARRRLRNGARASRSRTPRYRRSTTGRRASAAGRLRPHPMAHRALRLAARQRADRGAPVARAWRLSARQFSRTRRTHLRDPRLGARPSRRSRRGSRLGVPAAISRRHAARLRARRAKPIFSPATRRSPGCTVDPASLRFYIVFSLLKLAFTHMAAARCFEDGLFNDLRMPAMATQIAPVFRQIAKIAGERGMNNSLAPSDRRHGRDAAEGSHSAYRRRLRARAGLRHHLHAEQPEAARFLVERLPDGAIASPRRARAATSRRSRQILPGAPLPDIARPCRVAGRRDASKRCATPAMRALRPHRLARRKSRALAGRGSGERGEHRSTPISTVRRNTNSRPAPSRCSSKCPAAPRRPEVRSPSC